MYRHKSTACRDQMEMTNYRPAAKKDTELRIVLLGKTGVGKSAAGNSMLRRRFFNSCLSFTSVTSVCEKKINDFEGLKLAVIDTPGLFDTDRSNKEIMEEIAKGICLAAPGPHVFLIVLQPTRFTTEEEKCLKIIQKIFGNEAATYTMILFTHGDELKQENIAIREMLKKHRPLERFISQCAIFQTFEDKYHVFDNTVEDPGQVRGLVQKINRLVKENGGSYYTNEMLEDAERAKQEEADRLIREDPEIDPEVARRRAEKDNSFMRATLGAAAAGAATGAGVGAAIGVLGGPLGVAVGAGVGVNLGAIVGAAAAVQKMGGCSTQ
ncbi:GTPase IMAP family member 9-like [Poeciliopsis prolifica]|uniref:GTPase IMAP family member 9-like n=1 Tax=Poeciliopsis prolifica TaxID=188132 RepID=UPI002413C610|nr:GTPase IMAP family member 9-like [Poeciliopsis prolifica]